jgi:hypothetical protein
MKKEYVSKSFNASTMELIDLANEVVTDFMGGGYRLTLRQLFYQLVGQAKIPNTSKSYDRLGRVMTDARNAGLVDWNAIEDRTRNIQRQASWEDAGEILDAAMQGFKLDRWIGQYFRPEVWIEKQALESIALRACQPFDVAVMVCRGYMSASEMEQAGRRMIGYRNAGQEPVIIHLGDHDPSGIDMTRDNRERLELYSGKPIQLIRVALEMPQIEANNLPPNPTKLSDSRADEYIGLYGESSWELDALRPQTLIDIISGAIDPLIDPDALDMIMKRERSEIAFLVDALQRHREENENDDIPF